MSDVHDHTGMPDDELLAAEYALGVLAGAERTAAAERIAREPAFAALVAAWEERLAPWAGEIGEIAPPPHVWEGIVAALPAPSPQRTGLWQSIAFWRGFALASALAAASLAALIFLGTFSTAPPLLASIEGGGHRQFVATIDTRRGTIAVVPAAFAAVPAKVPELWLIPSDGKPRPLGLLQADRTVTIVIPGNLVADTSRGAVLAVSLEPPGGSPTGQPTGPVIATGKLTTL